MRKFLLFCLTVMTSIPNVMAQTQPETTTAGSKSNESLVDSVGTRLDEVVVEGRTQRVIKNGVEYIPGKNMKKSALDAAGLLYNMQIPQIVVSPFDKSVTTPTGQGVSMFIDYAPASKEELDGMRPEDVLRVEVLEYPEDPRFEGSARVVNFIMKHYDWGGYTKLTAYGMTLATDYVSGNVYNKFVTGRWTIDAYAGGNGSWCDKWKQGNRSTFRDFVYNGVHYDEATRTATTEDNYTRNNGEEASLRFTYRTDTKYVLHTVGFSRSAAPYQKNDLSVNFTRGIIPSSDALNTNRTQSINARVAGNYRFTLPRSNYFTVAWSYGHSGNNANSLYDLSGQAPILNGNRERVNSPEIGMYYSKYFPHNNSLSFQVNSVNTFYDTDYSGSFDGKEKMVSSENLMWGEYRHSWNFGLSLFARAGASYTLGRLNGENLLHQWNPRFGLQLQYRMDSRNIFGIEGWMYNSYPNPAMANGALVKSNELLWSSGNPDLKTVLGRSCEANYTFVPRNNFSLTASLNYSIGINRPYYDYISVPGIDGLVRTYGYDNREKQFKGLLTASLRLLNNSLGFYVQGGVNRQINSGAHAMNKTSLTGLAYVYYMVGNFSATAYYAPPTRNINGTAGIYEWGGDGHGLNLAYSLKAFDFQFDVVNVFSSGRFHQSYNSDRFAMESWNWTDGRARSLRLTVTYTLPYGKQVSRDNELQNATQNRSAILEH